jgi:hypothetical protein
MAKKLTVAQSAELERKAQEMGIDLSKIDWQQMLTILLTILQAFKNPKQAVASSGIPAEHHDTCTLCCEGAAHALEAARCCLECCADHANGGY